MSSLGVIVCSILFVYPLIVHIPHVYWKSRVTSGTISIQSAHVVIFQPINDGLEVWMDAVLVVI